MDVDAVLALPFEWTTKEDTTDTNCWSTKIDRLQFNLQWTVCNPESVPRSALSLLVTRIQGQPPN